ncbi:hypothetical protein F511_40154 [Dorcoceras hygrometricum]|uniref:Uncharacterized protein n=1 Tax=Dorcoceras hygrometricum TaxID=472368 RepID=A0A2Z7C760_9LAMI|nr:hypothetical protein F511_40154 [Dorcoceras hygrometricum]
MHEGCQRIGQSMPTSQPGKSKASLYTTHSKSVGGNHRSVIFKGGHSITHHSSVVFRHDLSVGHHSDDSVGPFKHDTSVCRSQCGSFSDFTRTRQLSLHQSAPSLVSQTQQELLGELKSVKKSITYLKSELLHLTAYGQNSYLVLTINAVRSKFSYVSPSSLMGRFPLEDLFYTTLCKTRSLNQQPRELLAIHQRIQTHDLVRKTNTQH